MSLDDLEFDHARAAVFDSLADGWDERVARPSTEALSQLIDLIEINGKVVLDIGSGTEFFCQCLPKARPSGSPVTFSENARNPQRKIRRKDSRPGDSQSGFTACRSVATALMSSCATVYPHFRDKRRALLEIRRVLRPSGALIINHFVGRDTVNRIHGSSQNEVLRVDLLPTPTR